MTPATYEQAQQYAQAIRDRIEVVFKDAEHNEYPHATLAAKIYSPKEIILTGYMIGIKDALEIITGARE